MNALERRASFSLALIYALRMLGLFMVLPVFTLEARHYEGGNDPTAVGLALGLYGLVQAVLQIPFGLAADRFGRKRVIVAGLLLFALGSVVAALATSVAGLAWGRALQGGGAISAAVSALLADQTRESVRTKGMALIGASIGLMFALSLVVGPLLIMGLAIHWRLLPVALWTSPAHVVLPTLTLGLYFSGRVARLMREGMLTTLHEHYITTARAKGLDDTTVLLKHALRIAVLPVVSYSGPLLADLLTGSFIVENLFQIPGIGVFMVNSSLNRDYPMVIGLVLLYAALLLVLNLLVDVAYSYLDRRVKYE